MIGLLLVADARANRRRIASLRQGLRSMLPLDPRGLLAALGAGDDPGGSGIIVL